MSKYYIKVDIQDNEYVNPVLIKKSLFSRKKFNLISNTRLVEAMNNNEIEFIKASNGKAARIYDMNVITEYSRKSKKIIRRNKVRKVLATTALVASMGIAGISYSKDKKEINNKYNEYEHQVENIEENNNNIIEENKTTTDSNNEDKLIIEDNNLLAGNKINKNVVNNEDDDKYTFSFNYEDRSDDFKEEINEKYGDYINLYSDTYGMDANLITAILCQENPTNVKNDSDVGGYGLMQVESVNDGSEISVFNFNNNDFETITIDTNRCNNDENYGIKVGTMLFSYCYNFVKGQNENNKFSNEEEVILSVFAYNKGIGTIGNAMKECNSLEDCFKYIKDKDYGDDEYIEHVFSRIKDGNVITLKDKNGNETSIRIDNENVNTYKKR